METVFWRAGAENASSSELSAGRQEGELLVRLAKSGGEDPHAVPEDLEGQVLVQKELVVERLFGDDEQASAFVDARIGRARGLVEERHLTEHLARPEHGERFFAHAGDLARDPDFAVEQDEELVAGIAELEDLRTRRVRLFGRCPGDESEGFVGQAVEERDARQLLLALGERRRPGGRGACETWCSTSGGRGWPSSARHRARPCSRCRPR